MSKFLTTVLLVSTFIMLAGYQNCGMQQSITLPNSVTGTTGAVSLSGTVQKSSLDGCNYLICSTDNANNGKQVCFVPVAIDQTLLNAGNVVAVEGVVRDDMVSTCMGGSIVQVNSATLVSGQKLPAGTTPTMTAPTTPQ